MKTGLIQDLLNTPEGREAEKILRSCVHCGFCNATCPTYQLLGDELDGPRGRIYLIKQVLEGSAPSRQTQSHLDRCLTCRNCESTCPSGVQYGHLLDIGRARVNGLVTRPLSQRLQQRALRGLFLSPRLFRGVLRAGQTFRPLLGAGAKAVIPARQVAASFQGGTHTRKVLLIPGCVQPGLRPGIDVAARKVFDRLGIACVTPQRARCCGSLSHHLNAEDEARAIMRANIDNWWPLIESGEVEAITMTASGCGVAIREYGRSFANDPAYAEKARAVSAHYRDPAEIVAAAIAEGRLASGGAAHELAEQGISFHPPCTLQHGQKLGGAVESILTAHGYRLLPFRETHLCCGSGGTYSITQKAIARQLRARKLDNILSPRPALIATANIGCLLHLQGGTETPVRHWLELLA